MSNVITELDVALELLVEESDAGQTILHCKLHGDFAYRIWPSTNLIDNNGRYYKLLHAENISYFPNWTMPKPNSPFNYFTLIFERLQSDVAWFYMYEQTNTNDGFYTKEIKKNQSGVYHVEILTP